MIKGIYYEITFIIMALYYPCFRATYTYSATSVLYMGKGHLLIQAATGTTDSAARANLTGGTIGARWTIRTGTGGGTFWLSSTAVTPYIAIRAVFPEYLGPVRSGQATTGATPAAAVTFSITSDLTSRNTSAYLNAQYLHDIYSNRTTGFTSHVGTFTASTYNNEKLATTASTAFTSYYLYGSGTTQWSNSAIANRYLNAGNIGFLASFEPSSPVYYTSQPAQVNTGYTVTINAPNINMTVHDEVQGYGTHSIRAVSIYAVTTGGTETLILSKAGATTISFGLTTLSLGRQTATVNGVKRFKMTFVANAFNGVGATECAVAGVSSDVYDYEDGTYTVEMYTADLTMDLTIASPGVDLILSAGY